jgi:multiple sugar transport system permease protein
VEPDRANGGSVTIAVEHRNEIAYDHIPASRRTAGRAVIWLATIFFVAVLMVQIFNRAGWITFGFETWRPVLYATCCGAWRSAQARC